MEVEQNVVNIVDPQAGVVQQQRDVLVRAPRRDGGVDVLLARTVKTVRLPPYIVTRQQPIDNERTPLNTSVTNQDSNTEESSCSSLLGAICTLCCLLSCLPCNDKACFSLWQIIIWIGLLSLGPLTVIGPLHCEPLHSTSITVLLLLSAVAMLSIICFLFQCCCTKSDKDLERCCLSCCGCLNAIVFIVTVVFGSYLIFGVHGNFDAIMDGHYLENGTNFIDCRLTALPLITMIFSYGAILIYVVLIVGCCYYMFRIQGLN